MTKLTALIITMTLASATPLFAQGSYSGASRGSASSSASGLGTDMLKPGYIHRSSYVPTYDTEDRPAPYAHRVVRGSGGILMRVANPAYIPARPYGVESPRYRRETPADM